MADLKNYGQKFKFAYQKIHYCKPRPNQEVTLLSLGNNNKNEKNHNLHPTISSKGVPRAM